MESKQIVAGQGKVSQGWHDVSWAKVSVFYFVYITFVLWACVDGAKRRRDERSWNRNGRNTRVGFEKYFHFFTSTFCLFFVLIFYTRSGNDGRAYDRENEETRRCCWYNFFLKCISHEFDENIFQFLRYTLMRYRRMAARRRGDGCCATNIVKNSNNKEPPEI